MIKSGIVYSQEHYEIEGNGVNCLLYVILQYKFITNVQLKSSLRKFDLVKIHRISVSQMTMDICSVSQMTMDICSVSQMTMDICSVSQMTMDIYVLVTNDHGYMFWSQMTMDMFCLL
jgi:hypothetical protein